VDLIISVLCKKGLNRRLRGIIRNIWADIPLFFARNLVHKKCSSIFMSGIPASKGLVPLFFEKFSNPNHLFRILFHLFHVFCQKSRTKGCCSRFFFGCLVVFARNPAFSGAGLFCKPERIEMAAF
jgi:hypothetical protein